MPFKYKLYSLVCYLTLLVMAILFLDIFYQFSRPEITITKPALTLTVLFFFFGSYFALPIFGLNLLKSMNGHSGIKNSTVIFLRIVVFIQVIFQAIGIYGSPEIFRMIIGLLKNHFRFYPFNTSEVIVQLLGIPLLIFSLYLEIVTFLVVKEVKNKQHAIVDELGL